MRSLGAAVAGHHLPLTAWVWGVKRRSLEASLSCSHAVSHRRPLLLSALDVMLGDRLR
jgi:hypothetical protein